MPAILVAAGHHRGLRHETFMASVVETGGDSVSAGGIPQGLDVYVGYTAGAAGYRSGGYSNMAAIKAAFPGRQYISVGTSAIDIEPGLASVTDARAFVENWQPDGLVQFPLVYASMSNMSAIMRNLAGVTKTYGLWVAAWDGSPSIPAGYVGKQYANHPGYDADSFDSSIFSGVVPVPTPVPTPTPTPGQEWPMVMGSPYTSDVMTLQRNLNNWASEINLAPLLVVDGKYGPKTAAAVTQAQIFFHISGPAGDCPQSLFNALQASPTPAPVPTPTPTPTPIGSTIDIDGFNVGKPNALRVPCVISWNGDSGVTRRYTEITQSLWQQINWLPDPSPVPTPTPAPVPTPTPVPVPTPVSGYKNPLRGITGLAAQRIDQGVDYGGSGPLYSIGNGVVLNTANAGWPGGAFISVRLADGTAAGKIFYFAENIRSEVVVGQSVTPDTILGTLIDAYPNSELGWAAEPGTGESMARAAGQAGTNNPTHANTAFGKNFSDFLVSLGAPAGILSGSVVGSLPAGWPTWGSAPSPTPTPTPTPTPSPTPSGQYPGPDQAVAAPFAQINGEIIYGYLRQHGYTPVAAAGATASMWGEGEWSPEVAGSGGWGLMGWTGNYPDSRTGNSAADMAKQLPMILQFVSQFGDTAAVVSMQHASSVLAAANIWGVQVERFGINDVHPEGIAAVKVIAAKLDGINLP